MKPLMLNNVLSPLTVVLKSPDLSNFSGFTESHLRTALGLAGEEESAGNTHARLTDSLELYVRRMVSHCAVRIHIPYTPSERWLRPRKIKSLLSQSSAKYIHFVDQRRRIWNAVLAFLKPLSNVVGDNDTLSRLAWNLYLVTLASQYKAEVVLSPKRTLSWIGQLDQLSELDAECHARLAILAGMINCFEEQADGPCLRFLPNATRVPISERLEEILEDAYLLEASRLRRLLGVKQNVASIKRDLRKVLSHICNKSNWAKGLLAIGSTMILGGDGSAKALEKLIQIIPSVGSLGQQPVLTEGDTPYLSNQEACIQIIRGMSGDNLYCFGGLKKTHVELNAT